MHAIEDERAFFSQLWPDLRTVLEEGGADALVESILGRDSDAERSTLFRFVRQGLVFEDWNGKSLDAYMSVVDAGRAWLSERAQAVPADERNEYLAVLAELTFNFAADIADCWPGDDEPRAERHFQRGVEVAEQTVGLREALGKPDSSKHLGWWAFGYHQLRLGHTDAAADCMERSLEHARQAARAAGEPADITSQAPFQVLIGAGYLGLARIADGEPSGPDLYGEAVAAFRAQLKNPERKDDAQFGIDQLERVRGFIS
ncbi:MAG: hypothetical protein OEP52_06720 [Acidimicrobiia bacterium]|nr:hypothetical protein [Acidimicrobiia bacterium]